MWGAAQPSGMTEARLRLDFGLRPAILAFNEWAVPGLGGAFFVRQLSWACMGLRLAEEVATDATPAQIAEAMEALASWIVIRPSPVRVTDPRVQGKRKLADRDSLSFRDIARRGAYVTVPFRRSATRALPGLGFCVEEQARFSALELGSAGIELAELAFASEAADGEDDARRALRRWIEIEDRPIKKVAQSIKAALDPRVASDAEKNLVRSQTLTDARRANLAVLLAQHTNASLNTLAGRASFLHGVTDREHAERLRICFAFEDLRRAALDAAQSVSDAIEAAAQRTEALAAHSVVSTAFGTLADHARGLAVLFEGDAPPEAREFCDEQAPSQPLQARVAALTRRVPLVFSVIEDRVDKGIGYSRKRLAEDDPYDPGENDLPPTLGVPRPLVRLRRLLADCEAQT